MITLILVASQKWAEGYSLANIAREMNIPFERLLKHVKQNPELFKETSFATRKPSYEPQKGRMPPKAPGVYGVPKNTLLKGQCCFPLWGDNEIPNELSLMCGEPVREKSSYCDFHVKCATLTKQDNFDEVLI